MLGTREEKAELQSTFYRNMYYRVLRWIMVSAVIICVLILAIIYNIIVEPSVTYYGNTVSGRVLPMPELS